MPTSIQVTPQPGSEFRVGPWVLLLTIILGPQPSLVQGLELRTAIQLCPQLGPTP